MASSRKGHREFPSIIIQSCRMISVKYPTTLLKQLMSHSNDRSAAPNFINVGAKLVDSAPVFLKISADLASSLAEIGPDRPRLATCGPKLSELGRIEA